MKIDKRNPRHWLLLFQQGLYTVLGICARYLTPRPGKPVVVLYGHQLSGNLKALYEEWQRAHSDDMACYFLSLDSNYGPELSRQGIKVLLCNRLGDMLKVGRCQVMITDHGLHAMSWFIPLTDMRFVDVWHGIPFKGFIPEDFTVQHRYDEVWVSSDHLKDLYTGQFGFHPSRVFSAGYARTDKLFRNVPPSGLFRERFNIPKDRKIVLFAPTWQQDDNGHLLFPFGEDQDSFSRQLSAACNAQGATLIIRSHLNAKITETASDAIIYCSMKNYPDTEDLLQETDILICDWSSISFDYLALNRPAIFLDVRFPYRNGFSLGPECRFGEIVTCMDSLTSQVEEILSDSTAYRSRHNETHEQVTSLVYSEESKGRAAHCQFERLTRLIQCQ